MRKLMSVLRQIPGTSRLRSAQREADDLRSAAIKAEAAADRMLQQRDQVQREHNDLLEQMARMAAENKVLSDHLLVANAALSDARDEARAARKARDLAHEQTAVAVAAAAEYRKTMHVQETRLAEQRRQIEDLAAEVADRTLTADGLGLAMAELERAAQRRVILPGQRADLHDVDQEKRYHDGLGDQ